MHDRAGFSRAPANTTATRYERHQMTIRKTRTKPDPEPTLVFAFAEYSAQRRRLDDEQRRRDLDLATSVGIEVGTMREADRRKAREAKIWDRGFIVGVLVAVALILLGLYSASLAQGATRPAPSAVTSTAAQAYPPHWRTWLRIGMCEQPKRGIGWHDVTTDQQRIRSIAWKQTYNYSFPGGLGFTRLNWDTFKPRSARNTELMSDATISQQLWAAERLWRWAERTYPTNGHTAWVCSYTIGWTTGDPTDAL